MIKAKEEGDNEISRLKSELRRISGEKEDAVFLAHQKDQRFTDLEN